MLYEKQIIETVLFYRPVTFARSKVEKLVLQLGLVCNATKPVVDNSFT